MSLKEKLEEIKFWLSPRTDETIVELKDHPLGNQELYRFHYVKFEERKGTKSGNLRFDKTYGTFILPDDMSREDAFKVLSFLRDYIQIKYGVKEYSYDTVYFLDDLVATRKLLGFKTSADYFPECSDKVIDLFTVDGNLRLFKKSNYYKKYFNWYTEGVTFEEFRDIYVKYGMYSYACILNENTPGLNKQLLKQKNR